MKNENNLDILNKKAKNKAEQLEFVTNLNKLLLGDKKLASSPLLIGSLPNILLLCCKSIGLDVKKNSKLYINKKTIEKIMRPEKRDKNGQREKKSGHFLKTEHIIAAINELKYPSLVLIGSQKETLVAITNIKDEKEQYIIVTVALNKTGATGTINSVTSIYGRENFKQYIINNINSNNIIAINKEKANELLLSIGVDFPEANTIINFDNSISYTYYNVKFDVK